MKTNLLLNADSYKASMFLQYPPKTEAVFSYIESRGGRYDTTVFFGLQAFIKEYLLTPITQEDIDEADAIWTAHGEPFNREGWQYILDTHNGYMPVEINAAPEGMVIQNKNVLATIENTDPNCFWLTTFLETALLRAVWFPTTVATNSREIKKIIARYLNETGDVGGLAFKLHDFGMRGTSSYESSMLGGMAHIVNFMGTDTISSVVGAKRYYNSEVSAFSIPASEHSISTAWGPENEEGYATNMVDTFSKDYALFATVADTYNVYEYVKMLGTVLKEKVIALGQSGKTWVVRPDSGDPTVVPIEVIELLMERFGYTTNEKGYKVLPSYVRVIQGDGVNADSIETILSRMKAKGISADNIAFGMGGALLGAPQRDDQKFAMKASAIKIDGEWKDIYKDPITDRGKTSKRGRLGLVQACGLGSCGFQTVPKDVADKQGNILRPVFRNGELLVDEDFETIRSRAALVESEYVEQVLERY